MKIATIIARVLLGLMFAVFGANKFFHFIPMPPPQGLAGQFMGAMAASNYLAVVAVCEVVGGLLLLAGRYVPLGLTLLGPVIVNIVAFHIFMDRGGLPMSVIVAALSLFLLARYRANFAGLLGNSAPEKVSAAQS